jgi:hypothetical protein
MIERRSINDSCCFAAVPDSISKLVNLTILNLGGTGISSERSLIDIPPVYI